MRSVSGAEILTFARLLMIVPPLQQRNLADRSLGEVETAASQLRQFGRCHPGLVTVA